MKVVGLLTAVALTVHTIADAGNPRRWAHGGTIRNKTGGLHDSAHAPRSETRAPENGGREFVGDR